LADNLTPKNYNGRILQESQAVEKLYMISNGKVVCKKKHKVIKTLTEHNYFGDAGLFIDGDAKAFFTYETEGDVTIYEITYNRISEVLGAEYINGIIHEMFLRAMKGTEKIIDLLLDDVQMLGSMFKLRYYASPEVVYLSTNKKHKKVTVVICGRLIKNSVIVANQEELFGEFILDSKEK
jgi:signal-transduction protein with cAMP-binding, CBS, and nucleotidyltransferase domain